MFNSKKIEELEDQIRDLGKQLNRVTDLLIESGLAEKYPTSDYGIFPNPHKIKDKFSSVPTINRYTFGMPTAYGIGRQTDRYKLDEVIEMILTHLKLEIKPETESKTPAKLAKIKKDK